MKKYITAILVVSLTLFLTGSVLAESEMGHPIIKQVSLGLAVDTNGTLWGWGDNSTGKLDDIGSGDRLDPWTGPYQTTPIKLMEDVTYASGGAYIFAIKTDETLWFRGQGKGWTQLLDSVSSIKQGGGSYAAIKRDGSLWLWGDNRFGQLTSDSAKEDYSEIPVKVMDDVKDVSLNGHILAVKNDGTLWTWGMGSFGTLGSGQIETGRKEPIQILDHVNKIATGCNNSFAVKTDGSLWAWGLNILGELGNEGLYDVIDGNGYYIQTMPTKVMTGVTDIATGHGTTYIIKDDTTLWACGSNQFGQAGTGNTSENATEPIQILDRVTQVTAGDCICYAVKDDGTLWSWGTNGKGELGYFGGDEWSNIGPQQTYPKQVISSDGMPTPLEMDIAVSPDIANIIIDDNTVSFPVLMSYDGHGGGTTYVRLRDLAYEFNGTRSNFNVVYNDKTEVTSIFIGGYMPIGGEMAPPVLRAQTAKMKRSTFGSSSTFDVEYYHTITVTDDEGNSHTYIRLRDLAPSHYFDVTWNGRQIIIKTGTWYSWSESQN